MNLYFIYKNIVFILIGISIFISLSAQSGVRFYDDRALEGYALYESGNRAVLINNCGELVNEWQDIAARFHPKLQPNGNLVYLEVFTAKIIEKDWDDNIVNEIEINSSAISPDYEVIVLENGNYLSVGRRTFSQSQFNSLGYDYGFNGIGTPSQVDVVMEIDRFSGNIVWLWDISDHVIQGRDSNAGNYGDVAAHPELLNMDAIDTYDWTFQESFMINGFDYNPELDQIALSVRKMSEVVIIDHSTTTAEAAGHNGGNSGKGGDLLYRWGNPQNYGRGTENDRKLWFQHNPNWIKDGEHAGKLIVYNNGLSGPFYSTAPIIDTPVDADGNYMLPEVEAFAPSQPDLEYGQDLGESFFSGYTSAAKVLANGNILITVGGDDRAFELLPDGTLVWEYGLYDSNLTFRVEKYSADYPAFDGRDLTPGDVVEFPPSNVECNLVNVDDAYFENTQVYSTNANLIVSTDVANELICSIYSADGKLLMQNKVNLEATIDISNLYTGIYLVQLMDQKNLKSENFKIFR